MAFGFDLSEVWTRLDNTEKTMIDMGEALHTVIQLLERQNELLAEIANKEK
jgi:hypothetical protein